MKARLVISKHSAISGKNQVLVHIFTDQYYFSCNSDTIYWLGFTLEYIMLLFGSQVAFVLLLHMSEMYCCYHHDSNL